MIDDTPTSAPPEGLRELPRKLEDQLLPGLEERLSALRDDATGAMDMAWIYRHMVMSLPGVVYVDPAFDDVPSIYVSPQVEALIGVTPEEWLADPYCWARHVHPDDYDRVWDEYLETIEKGLPLQREYRMIHEDGSVHTVVEQALIIPGDDGQPFLVQGVLLDVTDRRNADELSFLAYHDPLTGLPNRSLFEEMLTMGIATARRSGGSLALLFLDLDNFKQVNDTMGHHVGDALLRDLGGRLKPCLRESDVLARRSGDEFLILLTDLDGNPEHGVSQAKMVAERIHAALEQPFDLGDVEYRASASIGISLYPHDADDVGAFMKHADEAMYASKRTRAGGWCFYTGSTEDETAPNRSLSDRIHDAVEHDAWTLHWQPIVELSSGRVVGAEALIRWRDVNGGIVPPGEFLPIAEELGLIESIGEWVVDELGRQDAAWRAKGLELLLSFNLAPRQLWSAHLSEKLIGRLRDAGVAPGRVILDIAEGTAMADPERAQKVMAELQCWGLKLAIDDFGTAHSSFARLVNFPVDYLKIDRQFVRGVDVEPGQAALVRAITSLADSLSVSPVAVGVETEGEADFLRRLGVPFAQGFLFGRPMEGDAMVESFATHGV
jgi:diguanylate cyclase (GGDEF)-like protein/PAS domain S-box-containing protein